MLMFCSVFRGWNNNDAVCRFDGRSRCLPFGCLSNGVLASKKSTEK